MITWSTADMFDRHIPAKYRDRAPKIVQGDHGFDQWEWCGVRTGSVGLNAVASWPHEEWGFDPIGFAEMRPGCYDVRDAVRDMDANGVLSSMCFPTFAGFNGMSLARAGIEERSALAAVVAAYNDWHIGDWAASHPGRSSRSRSATVGRRRHGHRDPPRRAPRVHRHQPPRSAVRRRHRASRTSTGT